MYDIGRQGQGVGLVEVDGARTSRTQRVDLETVSVEHARSGRISKVVGAKVQGAITGQFPETNRSTASIN